MKKVSFLQALKKDFSWKIKILESNDYVHPNLRKFIFIKKVSNNSVTFEVANSSLANELKILQEDLIKKINSILGEPRIQRVFFQTSLSLSKKKQNPLPSFKKLSVDPSILSDETTKINQVELSALNKVNNKQLSEFLKSFLIRCKAKSRMQKNEKNNLSRSFS